MSDPAVNDSLQEILTKLNKLDTLEEKVGRIENTLKEDVTELTNEVDVLKVEWKDYKTSQDDIKRSENILVYGLRSKDKPSIIGEFMEVCKYIGVDIRKYDIKTMITSRSARGPVRFSFISSILRIDILANKRNLSASNTFGHIKIKDDHSPEVRKVRGLLFPYLKQYREEGRKVGLRNDKLLVDGVLRSLKDIQKTDKSDGNSSDVTEPQSFPPGRFRRDTRGRNERGARSYSRNNGFENNEKVKPESGPREKNEQMPRKYSRNSSLENEKVKPDSGPREKNEKMPRKYSRNSSLENDKVKPDSGPREKNEKMPRKHSRSNSLEKNEKVKAVNNKEEGGWWQNVGIPLAVA